MSYKAILCMLVLAGCHQQAPLIKRQVSSTLNLPAPELGEVWTATNDSQAEEILQKTINMLAERAAKDTFTRRDAHPRAHGCVKAKMEVTPGLLAPELQVGIFAPTAPKSYDAWIRFSNGAPDGKTAHDLEKDVRGMAIKLMNVPGATSGSQDFVMITSEEFFSKDGADYLDLHEAIAGSTAHLIWYGITHPRSASRIMGARIQIGHPLFANYFSSVPYKLGSRSMRFETKPCALENHKLPKRSGPKNFLQLRLAETLDTKPGCFDFYVQPNMDPRHNIIEDPRLPWPVMRSPKIKVARINIPAQKEFTSTEQMNFCENLSMNPWHSHPDTRPLGQINRMRALVYGEISKLRHQQNGTTELEPVSHTPCEGETAALCKKPLH